MSSAICPGSWQGGAAYLVVVVAAFEETDTWPDVSAEEDDEEQHDGDYDGPYLQAVLSDLVRDVDAGDASGRIHLTQYIIQ